MDFYCADLNWDNQDCGTCWDSVKNNDEKGVDCGGVFCKACACANQAGDALVTAATTEEECAGHSATNTFSVASCTSAAGSQPVLAASKQVCTLMASGFVWTAASTFCGSLANSLTTQTTCLEMATGNKWSSTSETCTSAGGDSISSLASESACTTAATGNLWVAPSCYTRASDAATQVACVFKSTGNVLTWVGKNKQIARAYEKRFI